MKDSLNSHTKLQRGQKTQVPKSEQSSQKISIWFLLDIMVFLGVSMILMPVLVTDPSSIPLWFTGSLIAYLMLRALLKDVPCTAPTSRVTNVPKQSYNPESGELFVHLTIPSEKEMSGMKSIKLRWTCSKK